jgi:hypothetical protein
MKAVYNDKENFIPMWLLLLVGKNLLSVPCDLLAESTRLELGGIMNWR